MSEQAASRRFIAPILGGVQDGDGVIFEWTDLSGGRWDVSPTAKVTTERVFVTGETARRLGVGSVSIEIFVSISVEVEPYGKVGSRHRFRLSPLRTFPEFVGSVFGRTEISVSAEGASK